ncbi:hypothetical protein [Acidithiobacillus ferriphilus]|uniref:hypothetical protein n=1 Tax=Acidithiobacillus ferriphilus TaxID=1689834 RepID=UPI001C079CAF|nr:hypothetical protein [Acidithiobacillus ferriphilus]MBU2853432.1 hypothetical protein [Acidithiobacillus ferriphilus]
MAVEYEIAPRKLSEDGSEVLPAEFNDAQFYGVYARGINEHWGVGGRGPDADKLANHIQDFPTPEAAQAFVDRLQANAPQLEAVANKEPVTIAGVSYNHHEINGMSHYVAGGELAEYHTPRVAAWEIDRYLKTGELSPELAANAVAHPENLAKLDSFEQQNLKNFAVDTNNDPRFTDYRKAEGAYYRDQGAYIEKGVPLRNFSLDDMPQELRNFVAQNRFGQEQKLTAPIQIIDEPTETIGGAKGAKSLEELAGRGAAIGGDGPHPGEGVAPRQEPKQPSPMGGLDMAGMAEGATVLYSRADAPDTLRTGVLMHNQSTANGQRLDMLNDQGLRERLYTGPDQGHESPANRLAAVVGYATPTTEPLFVAGVGADGKIVEKPQDAQSFGVFFHDKNGEAVPTGQAITADLAEQLKTHIEQGRVPEPVEAPKTLASLGALRDLLDMPPAEAPKLEAENKNAGPDKPELKKPEFTPPDPSEPKPNNPQQPQQVQRIGLLSALLMHTANAGRSVVRAITGPDAEEWQHRAHAHMDRAQAHLDAIARHPAVQQYQQMQSLPNMPERAKAIYADTLLRNNPDLAAHYAQAKDSVDKSQDALFYMNKKGGKTDPALTEKAGKVYETASKLPDMESGASGGLFSSLKSFFSAQQTQTLRKP